MQFVTLFDATTPDLEPAAASPTMLVLAGMIGLLGIAMILFGLRRPGALLGPVLVAGPLLLTAIFLWAGHDWIETRHQCSQTARRLIAEHSFAMTEGLVEHFEPIQRGRGGGTETSFSVGGARYSYCGELAMLKSLAPDPDRMQNGDRVRITFEPVSRHIIRLELAVDDWSPRAVP